MSSCSRTVALIWIACTALPVTPATARTTTAASCSQEDVQAAVDQIGRSIDSGTGTRQELDPLREWNNTLGGKDADFAVSGTGAVHVHIKAGRDFLNDTPRAGYVPYAYPHPSAREDTAPPVEP